MVVLLISAGTDMIAWHRTSRQNATKFESLALVGASAVPFEAYWVFVTWFVASPASPKEYVENGVSLRRLHSHGLVRFGVWISSWRNPGATDPTGFPGSKVPGRPLTGHRGPPEPWEEFPEPGGPEAPGWTVMLPPVPAVPGALVAFGDDGVAEPFTARIPGGEGEPGAPFPGGPVA